MDRIPECLVAGLAASLNLPNIQITAFQPLIRQTLDQKAIGGSRQAALDSGYMKRHFKVSMGVQVVEPAAGEMRSRKKAFEACITFAQPRMPQILQRVYQTLMADFNKKNRHSNPQPQARTGKGLNAV